MMKAHKDLEVGSAIEPRVHEITQEKINTYSRYAFHGKTPRTSTPTTRSPARRASPCVGARRIRLAISLSICWNFWK